MEREREIEKESILTYQIIHPALTRRGPGSPLLSPKRPHGVTVAAPLCALNPPPTPPHRKQGYCPRDVTSETPTPARSLALAPSRPQPIAMTTEKRIEYNSAALPLHPAVRLTSSVLRGANKEE
ncbi:unnamed protein product [Pleuronectes platessa]|uniref:Uncharacterized protein n=1 Tax=Pleuronectes platessa TaxID=8262 RepID=A0A9N7UTH0_PLEPL|nr:unnamed protein product [Pleuronectes platessa]